MTGRNDYPNPDNEQQNSFPQPVTVPDGEPDAGSLLYVGYNPVWTPVLMAAVSSLLQYGTWDGTPEEKILAVNRAALLQFLLQNPVDVGTGGIPTPFWDEATDVDDSETAGDQTWYGEVDDPEAAYSELTFAENVAIWGFTGFLAFSGVPGAALLFHTIAPSFVLAMRGGDFGEVIRILVDGEEAATVDTTGLEGELIEVPVATDPDIPVHEILMILVS